jgi:hypothetical protein
MQKDRKIICQIISDMLDEPNKDGIYPTSTAYKRKGGSRCIKWTWKVWMLELWEKHGKEWQKVGEKLLCEIAERELSKTPDNKG